ncbi:MAG: hypothetical protein LBJ01_08230 [Tannerella sp.]|jgi:hypothetical protein|nr:hypothetical protein [Tannerella sp.]
MKFKKHRLSIRCLILSVLLPVMQTHAQTLIEVRLDSADILIGEQTTLHLTITTDTDRHVYWPLPDDQLMPGVEMLSLSQPDSTVTDRKLTIRQDILVTSFDSMLYLLPPFRVIDGTDTAYSSRVALKVSTLPVDTDHPEEFFDIKDVWKPPFVLADYYPLIFGIIIALTLLFLIWYAVKRLRSNRSLVPFKRAEPPLPPHDEAIQELDRIKHKKLWQQGRYKEYHTQITDALRHYLSRRYTFNAMEMTSHEILEVLREKNNDRTAYDTLRQILYLADFVKFAKLYPLPDENSLSMSNAYLFVDQTKPEEVSPPPAVDPDGEETEMKYKPDSDTHIKGGVR